MLLGELLALEEAAASLGVSRVRLRQRLLAGEMIGIKRANAWFVPALEVRRWADLPRASHRPFSAERAWRVLADLSSSESPRPPEGLAAQLHRRAERHALYVHPGLLRKADQVQSVLVGGVEALARSGLVGGYSVRDLYVGQRVASSLMKRLGARPAVEDLNLVLHVVPRIGAVPRRDGSEYVAEPVAALDLIEGYDARMRALGRDLWLAPAAVAA